jgi:hypothetical protein
VNQQISSPTINFQTNNSFGVVVIKAAQVIKNADAILFTSGAGLGVGK